MVGVPVINCVIVKLVLVGDEVTADEATPATRPDCV